MSKIKSLSEAPEDIRFRDPGNNIRWMLISLMPHYGAITMKEVFFKIVENDFEAKKAANLIIPVPREIHEGHLKPIS